VAAFGGLVGLALLALWLYCIFDAISSDQALVRNLPKLLWLLIVIFLPSIGSIAWLILGRPKPAVLLPGDVTHRPARRPIGIEDRPGFGHPVDQPHPDDSLSPIVREREEAARLRVWEEQLRRREAELRRREQDESGPGPAG
jgi:hypothetical protein